MKLYILFALVILCAVCTAQEKCNNVSEEQSYSDSLWNAIRESAKVKTDSITQVEVMPYLGDTSATWIVDSSHTRTYSYCVDSSWFNRAERRTDTIHCAVLYADKNGSVHYDTLYCVKTGFYNSWVWDGWTNIVETWFNKKWKRIKVCAVFSFCDIDGRTLYYK